MGKSLGCDGDLLGGTRNIHGRYEGDTRVSKIIFGDEKEIF